MKGKKEVLRLYHLIKGKNEYSKIKFLYFVDKDFDPLMNNNEIYETPVYSIENLYTTKDAFIRILKCEFIYGKSDADYITLLELFKQRQSEFHSHTTLFNAWLACQRDKSNEGHTCKLNLASFKLNQIVPTINLDQIVSNYTILQLESIFPEAVKITEQEVQQKIIFFSTINPQENFRGKFEIDFLFAFLEAIKIEFSQPHSRLKKKNGVQLNQSKKNLISEFSQYASTKNCLKQYLNNCKFTTI